MTPPERATEVAFYEANFIVNPVAVILPFCEQAEPTKEMWRRITKAALTAALDRDELADVILETCYVFSHDQGLVVADEVIAFLLGDVK